MSHTQYILPGGYADVVTEPGDYFAIAHSGPGSVQIYELLGEFHNGGRLSKVFSGSFGTAQIIFKNGSIWTQSQSQHKGRIESLKGATIQYIISQDVTDLYFHSYTGYRRCFLAPISVVAAAATFTGLTQSRNGVNTLITSAATHGLTTMGAVGYSVYVTWSGAGHTGIDGIYDIVSLDADTPAGVAMTIEYPFDNDSGTPYVYVVGDAIPFCTHTIPGGSLGPNGSLTIEATLSCTNSANAKALTIGYGTTPFITTPALANVASMGIHKTIYNRGGRNMASSGLAIIGHGVSANALITLNEDTDYDNDLYATITFATANELVQLNGCIMRCIF